jgi:hypothetical protein
VGATTALNDRASATVAGSSELDEGGAVRREPPHYPAPMEAVSARFRAVQVSRGHDLSLSVGALTPALLAITITGFAALFALVGADARWLAALGRVIWTHHTIPTGIPFASASSAHWSNPIVLAELIFHGLDSAFGDRGLMLAQLAAVAVAVVVLARDAAAAGATVQATATSLLLVAVGALPDLSIARSQLFSVALFPTAAALLRSETRAPTSRIWLIVPLLALWSNLHGAALTGLGVTLVYLTVVRLRRQPRIALGVGLAALLAICATPAGLHTIDYYQGVLTNQAATRGKGLWAPISLTSPLDILFIGVAVGFAFQLRRGRPQLWEFLVLVMLAGLTVKTSRSGIWLLFFAVSPVARGFKTRKLWDGLLPALATVALASLLLAIARGPLPNGASPTIVTRAIALSHGTPVLAEDLFSEQVALAGGRIWFGDPIDAFSQRDQAIYLDWLQGKPGGIHATGANIEVVLTGRGDAVQREMSRDRAFRLAGLDRMAALYVRRQLPSAHSVASRLPHGQRRPVEISIPARA